MRYLFALFLAVNSFAATYPIKQSSNDRYVVDQNDVPVLLNSYTAWHMLVNISTNDAATLMDTLVAAGYNAIQTRLIDDYFQGDSADNNNAPPKDFYNVSPFTGPGYTWNNLNEAYFTRVRDVIRIGHAKGMHFQKHFCYAGFQSPSDQGFATEMTAASQADLESYATYIGNFFKNEPNYFWVNDGDLSPPGTLATKMNAMATALKLADPTHLITAHVSTRSRDHFNGQTWLEIESIYANRPSAEGNESWQQSPAMPIMLLDAPYEGDSNGFTEQQMRGQAYYSAFAGALIGFNYGHTTVSEGRTGWRDLLATNPTLDRIHAYNLLKSREWWKFTPDFADAVMSGKGDINSGTLTYSTTCRASDGRTIMAYFYAAISRTVNMNQITGTGVEAWWYNPTDGTRVFINDYPNTGTQAFTSAGERILVLDAEDTFANEPGDPIDNTVRPMILKGNLVLKGVKTK